jgi:hypothetical protein
MIASTASMISSGEAINSHPAEWCSPIPALAIAEVVEPLDQPHAAIDRKRGVLGQPVKRGQKDAKGQAAMGHARCSGNAPMSPHTGR